MEEAWKLTERQRKERWRYVDEGREGGSQYESCFHSNPNIAAMKSELRWETGAKQPSIIQQRRKWGISFLSSYNNITARPLDNDRLLSLDGGMCSFQEHGLV